jgi:uncharacterized protein
MTDEIMANILAASTLKQVEEIYKPYKSKKKTKAMIAIEKGFQVVADMIKQNITAGTIEKSEEFQVLLSEENTLEVILEGSHFIVAAEVSSHSAMREDLVETLKQYGTISSKIKTAKALEKLNEKDTKQIPKFDIYADFSCPLFKIKPYQILALNRGENL